MANTEIIRVLLDFKQNLSKNISPAITALERFQSRTETLRNAMTPLSIASAGFLTLAAKNAADFSASLKEAKKSLGLTNEELKVFSNQAKQVSENLNFQVGSEQILNIASSAGKLGIAKETLAEYTEGLVKLAVATNQLDNIEDLNENVAKINSVFKMGIPDLQKYYGAVNMLADSTSANPQDLIRFTQQIAGTASASKISAKNISAWGATLIDAGQRSGEAATFLRNFSVKLGAAENQSKKARDAFEILGYSAKGLATAFQKDAEGTMINFLQRVKELQAIDPVEANRVMASIFGMENISNANLLLGKLDDLQKNLKLVGDDNANAAKMAKEFEVSSEGLDGALRAMKNVLTELSIEIGTAFLPGIVKAATATLEFIKPILAFVRANPAIATTIATLLGIVAVIAPMMHLVGIISSILTSLPLLVTGVTAIVAAFSGAAATVVGVVGGIVASIGLIPIAIAAAVAAVVALGYAIYKNWGSISSWFSANVSTPLSKNWSKTFDFMKVKTTEFGNWFKADPIKASLSITKWFAPIPTLIAQSLQQASVKVVEFAKWLMNMENHFRTMAISWGKGLLQGFINGIQSKFADVNATMKTFTDYIGQWLPHSDAQRGELSRLIASGKAMAETFLQGLRESGLSANLNDAFSIGNQNLSGLIPISASSGGTGNQTPINITYNITARDSDDILKQLKARDKELLELINRSSNRINRESY